VKYVFRRNALTGIFLKYNLISVIWSNIVASTAQIMMVIAFIVIILPIKQEESNLFRNAKKLLNNKKALKTTCNIIENSFRVRITGMLLDMAGKWEGVERERETDRQRERIVLYNCVANFSDYTASVVQDRQGRYIGLKLRSGTEVFRKNPFPGPQYLPHIHHGIPGIGSGKFGHLQTQKEDALKATTLSKWCHYASFIRIGFAV
jgi:hypothetical protein